jgi:hypothetical protein
VIFVGDPKDGPTVLQPLRELGEPIVDLSGVLPYTEAQRLLDEDYPDGWRFPGFFEEGDELLRASYGDRNYERLLAVKDRVDPNGVFGPLGGIRSGGAA